MKVYDLLWKREEKSEENKSEEKKNGKIRWENVGVLIENEGKRSVKLNLVPAAIGTAGSRWSREKRSPPSRRNSRDPHNPSSSGTSPRSRTIAIWRLK